MNDQGNMRLLVLFLCLGSVVCSDEKRLIKHLLGNYERVGKYGRPVLNTSDPVTVHMGVSLRQIVGLDETNQVLTTNVWQRYLWSDQLLKWAPADFGNVRSIRVPIAGLWRPDIMLYNKAKSQSDTYADTMVSVSSDGAVTWVSPVTLESSCYIDMEYFPYDEQVCTLKFASWTYEGEKLDLQLYDNLEAMDVSDYSLSNEWTLLDTNAERNVQTLACCVETYPSLTFSIRMKRKPTFYHYALVLPTLLLSSLTPLVFLVPADSAIKVLFGLLLLLSFFLLLLIIFQVMPPTVYITSLVGGFVFGNMILVTLSVFLSVVVVNLYCRGENKARLPRFLKVVFVDGLSTLLCVKESACCGRQQPLDDESKEHLKGQTAVIGQSETEAANEEWRVFAGVLDRLFFLAYVVVVVIMALVYNL